MEIIEQSVGHRGGEGRIGKTQGVFKKVKLFCKIL